ncbi:MAG: hypothetical protein QM610_14960 [Chitinophagaceae bacterium]
MAIEKIKPDDCIIATTVPAHGCALITQNDIDGSERIDLCEL